MQRKYEENVRGESCPTILVNSDVMLKQVLFCKKACQIIDFRQTNLMLLF